jgi:hypothetical protein
MNIKIVKNSNKMIERNACFYMANLGSEFHRILRSEELGDKKEIESACGRALSIIDKLLSLPEVKGREGEVEILREIIQDKKSFGRKFSIPAKQIISYFMPFALRTANSL